MVNTTHYGHAMVMPDLTEYAYRVAYVLAGMTTTGIYEQQLITVPNKKPLLVYSGSSGIASATAINMAYYMLTGEQLHMLYVRKYNEKSNSMNEDGVELSGLGVEGKEPIHSLYSIKDNVYPLFVDDFICSGTTLDRVHSHLAECGITWRDEEWCAAVGGNGSDGIYWCESYDPKYFMRFEHRTLIGRKPEK